jgi:hypothetical protein
MPIANTSSENQIVFGIVKKSGVAELMYEKLEIGARRGERGKKMQVGKIILEISNAKNLTI